MGEERLSSSSRESRVKGDVFQDERDPSSKKHSLKGRKRGEVWAKDISWGWWGRWRISQRPREQ